MKETKSTKKPKSTKKAKSKKKVKEIKKVQQPTPLDYAAVKIMVRARKDFQEMRIKMSNRLGEKADGTPQNMADKGFDVVDLESFRAIALAAKEQELYIEEALKPMLKRFPLYNEYLKPCVNGVGAIAAGTLIAEFDIFKATTVSKLWQYAGLNAELVRGKKDIDKKDYKKAMGEKISEYTLMNGKERVIYLTNDMVRGDKLTSGFVAPFNGNLRAVLMGILSPSFLKCTSSYKIEYYDTYKHRLQNSKKEVMHCKKGGKAKMTAWKDVNDGHRDMASKRYMIKMFLKDLYVAWREIEGLEVRASYQEVYLGHVHNDDYNKSKAPKKTEKKVKLVATSKKKEKLNLV